MNLTEVLIAAAVLALIGLAVGLFIGFASIAFDVETNPKESQILEALPGNNCGACGFPGCANLAGAIAAMEAPFDACPVGGKDVADKIADLIGGNSGDFVAKRAFIKCAGNCQHTDKMYDYEGPTDCRMMITLPGRGPKPCIYGCMGGGDCVKECPYEAIGIKDGIAEVIADKCKGCGKCVSKCPQKLIELIPANNSIAVACSSKDTAAAAKNKCDVSCIGCGACLKKCPNNAISIENSLAHIDYDKCDGCGECSNICKRKVITGQADE